MYRLERIIARKLAGLDTVYHLLVFILAGLSIHQRLLKYVLLSITIMIAEADDSQAVIYSDLLIGLNAPH